MLEMAQANGVGVPQWEDGMLWGGEGVRFVSLFDRFLAVFWTRFVSLRTSPDSFLV